MRTAQLEYFKAVARSLSFTKAAEECHVAQPAISQQIRALENELGFDLFIRSTKGVNLTDAGRAYYHETIGVLDALERSAKRARAIADGAAGTLTVGISNSAQTALFNVLRTFSAHYPEVAIALRRSRSRTQMDELSRGDYDTLITSTSYGRGRADVSFANVQTSRLCIAVSRDHPLAIANDVTTADLKSFPHIIADAENENYILETYPYLTDSPETPIIRAEDQSIALSTMLMGLGVEAMPIDVASAISEDFVHIEPCDYDACLAMGWAYLAESKNPALRKFIEFLEHQMKNNADQLLL